MMRKIFGGAMAFSMVGAVVLGGVLAWSNSQEINGSSTVGSLSWAVDITTPGDGLTGDYIGPDDDHIVVAENAHIKNTGTAGSFRLQLDSGKVDITDTTKGSAGGPTDQNNCSIAWFGGVVTLIGAQPVLDIGVIGDPFQIGLKVHNGAPTACMGDTVSWKATITVKTVAQ